MILLKWMEMADGFPSISYPADPQALPAAGLVALFITICVNLVAGGPRE